MSSKYDDGHFTVIHKDDRSFHMKKTTAKHEYELTFSLRDSKIELTKNGEPIVASQENLDKFFYTNAMNRVETIALFSTDVTRPLFEFAFKDLSCVHYERVKKISRALKRLLGKPALQTLYFSGFTALFDINNLRLRDTETQPHKILGVPKYLVPYIKEYANIQQSHVNKFIALDKVLGGNNLKTTLQIVKEESMVAFFLGMSDLFLELFSDYGYKDVKRLTLYLLREVKLSQGISQPRNAAMLLRDYSRMSKAMGYPFYERYTKNLKKDHDVTSMNYQVNASEYKNKEFRVVTESVNYVRLAHRRNDFSIVVPDTVQSIIKEGSSLSHCVSSYVDDIISGKCRILYLRNTKEVDKPLVTVEVRDGNVRQVRGNCNRRATADEMSFVHKWAEQKELKVAVH